MIPIVIYVNSCYDIIHTEEEILVNSMNYINLKDEDEEENTGYEHVNKKCKIINIEKHNGNIYIKIANDYNSYIIGKVTMGYLSELDLNKEVLVQGYYPNQNGSYYVYMTL